MSNGQNLSPEVRLGPAASKPLSATGLPLGSSYQTDDSDEVFLVARSSLGGNTFLRLVNGDMPVLTNPVINGMITGAYTLAGTPTLGADLLPDVTDTRSIGSTAGPSACSTWSRSIWTSGTISGTPTLGVNLQVVNGVTVGDATHRLGNLFASNLNLQGIVTFASPGSIAGPYELDGAPTLGVNLAVTDGVNIGNGTDRVGTLFVKQVDVESSDSTGTPGDATLNTAAGISAFVAAAGGKDITITNSLVTATSKVFVVLQFVDATLTQILSAVPGAGSFVVHANADPTLATKFAWFVLP